MGRWPGPALLALTLGACAAPMPGGLVPVAASPPRPTEVLAIDPASADVARYYERIQSERLARGLMRQETTGIAPPDPTRLAATYAAVALRDEAPSGRATRPNVLRRWTGPVVYRLEFGATLPQSTRAADQAAVASLVSRMAAAARHPISLAPPGSEQGNFHVLVLSENERRSIGPRLEALIPGIDATAVRLITEMPRDTFCMAIAFSRDGSAGYTEAIAVIRAEHPDLTRLACYHEELAQGLGLAADSDDSWPSIFNDDQEFALITDHDLLLLRLHYDPRLSPGMTETRARPLIFSIASELAAGAI